MKAWMSSNFGKFATELLPLIDVRIEFLFNIIIIIKIIISIFKEDNVFGIDASLPYGPPVHESLDEFEFWQICNRVTALD